jgi:hypothetical protein
MAEDKIVVQEKKEVKEEKKADSLSRNYSRKKNSHRRG